MPLSSPFRLLFYRMRTAAQKGDVLLHSNPQSGYIITMLAAVEKRIFDKLVPWQEIDREKALADTLVGSLRAAHGFEPDVEHMAISGRCTDCARRLA